MSRERSPERIKAFKLWVNSGRQMKPVEIAEKIGVSASMVRKWKSLDKWDEQPDPKRGAPRGNKNAKGNKGGAPPQNDNAIKHGAYRKFLPQDPEYLEILDMVQEMDTLDMIYQGIETSFVAYVRMEKIMYVTSKDEMIKELKKRKYDLVETPDGKGKTKFKQMVTEEEYEFQFAWDRYATYAKTQAVILTQLRASIKQFLNAAPEDDERRMKLQLMQAQIDKAKMETDKAGKMEHTVIFKGGDQLED